MTNKIEVKIAENFHKDYTQLLFIAYEGMHRIVYNFYTEEARQLKENESYPEEFILKIPNHLVDPVFQALAKTLDKKGIKTPNSHKVEGELDATKYHLEDLRTIMKIK